MLTTTILCDIICKLSDGQHQCGGIAQLARATGSYPVGHGFKSNSRYQRPVGQAVKTPPFHGGNGGSIPPRVTKKKSTSKEVLFLFSITRIERESKGRAYVGTTGKNSPVDCF